MRLSSLQPNHISQVAKSIAILETRSQCHVWNQITLSFMNQGKIVISEDKPHCQIESQVTLSPLKLGHVFTI